MRPIFVLCLTGAAAFAAGAAAILSPDPDALPLRISEAVLAAEADAGLWRNAGLDAAEAGAFGNAMWGGEAAQGFTLLARAPGGVAARIHVMPAPQGGLILLADGGRWAHAAGPEDLRRALDALAAAGRPVDL